jgi:hypothetical protein
MQIQCLQRTFYPTSARFLRSLTAIENNQKSTCLAATADIDDISLLLHRKGRMRALKRGSCCSSSVVLCAEIMWFNIFGVLGLDPEVNHGNAYSLLPNSLLRRPPCAKSVWL